MCPIYEFECEACQCRIERLQKMDDPPLEVCPKCKSHMKKVFSVPALRFNGTGFYSTDYRNAKPEAMQKSTKGAPVSTSSESAPPPPKNI